MATRKHRLRKISGALSKEYISVDPNMYLKRYGEDNPWVQWARERGHLWDTQSPAPDEPVVYETYEEWAKAQEEEGA